MADTPTERTPNIRLRFEPDELRNGNWGRIDDAIGNIQRRKLTAEDLAPGAAFWGDANIASFAPLTLADAPDTTPVTTLPLQLDSRGGLILVSGILLVQIHNLVIGTFSYDLEPTVDLVPQGTQRLTFVLPTVGVTLTIPYPVVWQMKDGKVGERDIAWTFRRVTTLTDVASLQGGYLNAVEFA